MNLILPTRRRFLFASAAIVASSSLMPGHSVAHLLPPRTGFEIVTLGGQVTFIPSKVTLTERDAEFILLHERLHWRYSAEWHYRRDWQDFLASCPVEVRIIS